MIFRNLIKKVSFISHNLKLTIMKTLGYFLVLAILVFAGCTKDDVLFENQDNLELKKAKMPIPFKADCYAITDIESDLIPIIGIDGYLVHSRLIISGNATLFGKLDNQKSYYEAESLVFFIGDDGLPYTLNIGKGKVVAANGDSMEFTFNVTQSFDETNSYTGKAEFIAGSGTGKFMGCSGSCETFGGDAEGGTWFKINGYLVYE